MQLWLFVYIYLSQTLTNSLVYSNILHIQKEVMEKTGLPKCDFKFYYTYESWIMDISVRM